MPIFEVGTSVGQDNIERIDHLRADIYVRHRTVNQRISFPTSGPIEIHFRAIKVSGHERVNKQHDELVILRVLYASLLITADWF